ncbi:hypothetical protein D1AOALGA4SA_6053 [Olavius algarvensis Delta 1 endosymbiont]|nr:hypothetical protein D1AOALGA4SA_6053 [Olavius algarvensis Delta 1 endosymbiont]
MANNVLFLGWNRVVPGREQQAMNLWRKFMEYNTGLQSDGKIESFEPVILAAHGGDLNGFIMVRGEAEQLAKVRADDVFGDLAIEANYCLDRFGIVIGFTGDSITDQLSRWSKHFAE